jgi:hypothetical protein
MAASLSNLALMPVMAASPWVHVLDSVQTVVEVDELTVHVPEVLAKIGGEVLD